MYAVQLMMLMILKCIKCHSAFLFSHFDEDRDKDTTVFFRSEMILNRYTLACFLLNNLPHSTIILSLVLTEHAGGL